MKQFFFIAIALFFLCSVSPAQENPFLPLLDKPYREYRNIVNIKFDSPQSPIVLKQLQEAARVSGSKRWKMEAEMFEALFNLFHPLGTSNENREKAGQLAEEALPQLLHIFNKAEKNELKDICLRLNHHIINLYFDYVHNYEFGFRRILIQNKLLAEVSSSDFPEKSKCYLYMERYYNRFGEYEMAKALCIESIKEAEALPPMKTTGFIVISPIESALNDLGGIYRNHDKDLQRSDSCYNRILALQPPKSDDAKILADFEREHTLWSYIAKGNLGHNAYLRNDYETAIPLLRYSVEKVTAHNPYNFSFSAGKAILLADIFTKQGLLTEAKHYLDSANAYISRSGEKDRWHDYYPVSSRYYAAAGNIPMALANMDSALVTQNRHDKAFNLRKLHRAEQRVQQDELEAEKLRSEAYRRLTFIIAVFLSAILLLLGMLYYNYRKKKAAYHDLVQKNKQWAQQNTLETVAMGEASSNENNEIEPPATSKELEIIDEAHTLLLSGLFKEPELSLDTLAELMNINRNVLSRAINAVVQKNFNQFVNEYRVKEAIRIISANGRNNLLIEELYEQVGFNSRSAFFRTFKQATGLSPNEFKKSLM